MTEHNTKRPALEMGSSDGAATMSGAPDGHTVVGRFRKNRTDEVVVALVDHHGVLFADARVYAVFGEGNEPRPTRKGIRIRADLVGALIDALRDASAEAWRRGAIDEPVDGSDADRPYPGSGKRPD